ncbi:hypothetical protein ACFWVC_33065 [Streptomyces sp. NPDC058691]|uniref:hypothetical protein n=1 Tax=Streptomyces sp. NPDC058691 TaxID=3346601 RepID=UPI00365366EF
MRTTSGDRGGRPDAEFDREQAWRSLLELQSSVDPDRRLKPPEMRGSSPRLMSIARAYDRICRRADGLLRPEATETELLSALLVIRMLREKLDIDERQLMAAARHKKVTWQRIADALEMSGRQSAERRFLQLSRPSLHSDSPVPRTQNDRVTMERERRSRNAERQWAMEHAPAIRRIARQLTALDDLDHRVARSAETRILTALQAVDGQDVAGPERPTRRAWPDALRECLAEDEQFRVDPPRDDSHPDPDWKIEQQRTAIVHRLLGLVTYAAWPRNIELSDLPDLTSALAELRAQAEMSGKERR